VEKVNRISLELINLSQVKVINAYSKEGVPVTVDAVANVKISSDDYMLARAIERFLGVNRQQIAMIIQKSLEGHLRDIVGVLTVEQLYQERNLFVSKVLDQTCEELAKIGVIIDFINIHDIRDEKGYLEALGVKRTAEVQRDASIGKAEAERDAMMKSETAIREGMVVKADQEKLIAEAQRTRDVAQQQYRGQTLSAKMTADQQAPLAEAKALQGVVIEQQKVQEVEQLARKSVEEAKVAAEEQKYRAEVVVPAEAAKQAKIQTADGQAYEILKVRTAEAEGIKLVAMAEAEGLKAKAHAWEEFGEAAKLNLILETLKTVTASSAQALGQIKFDKVVAIDSGIGKDGMSSVSRLMNAAPSALVGFMEQIKTATGIDLEQFVKNLTENVGKKDTLPTEEKMDSRAD
jgi:flotillin